MVYHHNREPVRINEHRSPYSLQATDMQLRYINKIQRDATLCRYLFTAKLHTFFEYLSHTSSGVHKTVTAASGTGRITCQSNKLPPAWPN